MRNAALIAMVCLAACSARAVAVCTVAATSVAFGIYSPSSGAPLDSTATIAVTCITVLPTAETYTIKLSTGGAGSYARTLSSGSNHLSYNLYTDSARSVIWGDGTGGTSYQTFSGTLPTGITVTNYTTYGRMPAQQNAQVGVYTDAIIVTVNF